MTLNKIKPINFKIHPDFRELLFKIQQERIKKGMEKIDNKVPTWKLSKAITNMIKVNEKLYDALVEVRINGD